MTVTIWTPAEDAQLIDLRAINTNMTDIARVMGRRLPSVKARVARLGLSRSTNHGTNPYAWTAKQDIALREMFAAGMTDPDMGRVLGRNAKAISRRRRGLGLISKETRPDRPRRFADSGWPLIAENQPEFGVAQLTRMISAMNLPAPETHFITPYRPATVAYDLQPEGSSLSWLG